VPSAIVERLNGAIVIEASIAAFAVITLTASVHFVMAPAVDLD
jgi:hypothetical protein